MDKVKQILVGEHPLAKDLGALLMRVIFGGFMAFAHGLGKFQSAMEHGLGNRMRDGEIVPFADPLGIGNEMSMAGAVGAEFFCALLLIVGLGTRFVSVPLIFTMAVAGFIVHGADPFGRKELALIYLFAYTAILLIGPGRISLDHLIAKALGKESSTPAPIEPPSEG